MTGRASIAAFVVLASFGGAAFGADLVLAGGTCIDRAGVVTPDCLVVIDGGRIVRASPGSRLPRAKRVVDVSGRWIVPGFVDNHVHLGWAKADPEMWIRAGVTELVENGSSISPAELSRRYASGPRVQACGPIITKAGGYPAFVEKDAPALQVSGSDDAVRRTAAFIEQAHPRCLKLAIERGFESDLSDEGWPTLSRSEVEAVVKEARRRGLSVRAHVTQREEFDLAVETGVNVLAHTPIDPLPESSLRRAAERGVVIVSTVALWGDGRLRASALDNLARFSRLGGRIAIGSDYPNWKSGGLPMAELRALSGAGLTPVQLLMALTRVTVSPGDAADDLVVLGADPLLSFEALSEVDLVVRGGTVVFERTQR